MFSLALLSLALGTKQIILSPRVIQTSAGTGANAPCGETEESIMFLLNHVYSKDLVS